MKTQWMVKAACGAMAVAAVTFGIAGCASKSYEKGSATASGLKESAAKIESAQSKLDGTVAALNDLVNNPGSDLRPQYKKFSDSVDDLGALAKHVKESVVSMSQKSKEYFAKWDEETAAMKSEDIKTAALPENRKSPPHLMILNAAISRRKQRSSRLWQTCATFKNTSVRI